MNTQHSPGVLSYLPTAFILMLLGWGGIVYLGAYTTPNGGTRWLWFFTGIIAIVGTVLPIIAYLNRRFPSIPVATPLVIIRQSLWIGIYLAVLGWLQIGRVLTLPLALLLAIGLFLIEWLLRLRERSQWKP